VDYALSGAPGQGDRTTTRGAVPEKMTGRIREAQVVKDSSDAEIAARSKETGLPVSRP